MSKNKPWKATHLVTVSACGDLERNPLFDPEREQLLNDVPVMMIDDIKAHQEHEWDARTQPGDPDLIKHPGGWSYRSEPVIVRIKPL